MKSSWLVHSLCLVALATSPAAGVAQAQTAGEEAASDATPGGFACSVDHARTALSAEVRESSGLAGSARASDLFWTHNDAGNGAELFAVNASGELVQRVAIAGADAVDWEDIESGPCDSGSCLFIGDIGDNDGQRESITIYRIPEPGPDETTSAVATSLRARYPDRPRDAESLFRLPSGEMYLVTKGRSSAVELYRVPAASEGEGTVVLERVRELFGEPQEELDRVTAATASPDGEWVAIRSYRNLYLYRARELIAAGAADPVIIGLASLDQPQGESVVLQDDGTVWLSSEAASDESGPTISSLRCALPAD